MEIHEKKAGPDDHRLKTMVKRSIEHDLRNKNFGARNGNYERNAVVKNQGTRQRGQKILGDCWQWEAKGQCSKGDNCSFRHDINKRAKMTQPNPDFFHATGSKESVENPGRMFRWPCKNYLKGTCTNSFCEKWHLPECLFYKTKSCCRFEEKCSYAHRQVDEQPGKRSKKNGDKSAVAMLKKHELHDRTGKSLFAVTHVTRKATDLLCAAHQVHDNWVAFFRIWSRRSCHQFYGRAQTCRNQSNVKNSRKPLHVTIKFETKIPSLGMI